MAIFPWIRTHKAQQIAISEFPQVQRWYDRVFERAATRRGLDLGKELRLPKIDDEGWTGAEIRKCCQLADSLNKPLTEVKQYIVPVSKSAAEEIEDLRRQANLRFLSASRAGLYSMERPSAVVSQKRKIKTA